MKYSVTVERLEQVDVNKSNAEKEVKYGIKVDLTELRFDDEVIASKVADAIIKSIDEVLV